MTTLIKWALLSKSADTMNTTGRGAYAPFFYGLRKFKAGVSIGNDSRL